ncbi:MAG: exopolysaccharide biosynthesis polyprenyl glycosylphosphotransferase [Pseudobutyrivibrio sp.]|nr:exopolysaccharide biosynthesis polyprenyl glycosylphosphotransferase [Pseudobutyrivibrio sp.]
MKKNSQRKIKITQKCVIVLELVVLALVYLWFWRNMIFDWALFKPFLGRGKYILLAVYGMIAAVLISLCDGFKLGQLKLTDIMFSQWIALVISNIVTYLQLCLMANEMIGFKPILLMILADLVITAVIIAIYSMIYNRIAVPSKLLMVYGNRDSVVLKAKMDDISDRYRVKELVSIDEGLEKICPKTENYDAVVICDVDAKDRNDLLKYCYEHDMRTFLTPKISDVIIGGGERIHLFDSPLIQINSTGISLEEEVIKRFFDIVLCIIAVVVLSPLLLVVSIAIKLEDGGPVFYRQRRITKDMKEFDILKFRSMIVDAEKNGAQAAVDGDSRITKVGHFIRATRIDELPQLFNIIKGDMSIVGPRPERVENVEEYSSYIPEFIFRYKVKGGLTGYAQIFGKYNTTAYDKLRLDLMYIENYTLLLDLKIILMTIRIVFKKESTEGFDKVITASDILETKEHE